MTEMLSYIFIHLVYLHTHLDKSSFIKLLFGKTSHYNLPKIYFFKTQKTWKNKCFLHIFFLINPDLSVILSNSPKVYVIQPFTI